MDAITTWNLNSWGQISTAVPTSPASRARARGDTSEIVYKSAAVDLESMTDEQLVRSVSAGSQAALETLYDRHARGCFGLALKIVRDPSLADEVVQDVFTKLWSRPDSFSPGRGRFSGWLLALVHNRSVDKLRRMQSGSQKHAVSMDIEGEGNLTLADTLPDLGPSPFDEAWASEQSVQVRSAVGRLPEAQRQAIALAYFEGLTQREIAERLGQPLGTIKTRTRAALAQLRTHLQGQGLLGEAQ